MLKRVRGGPDFVKAGRGRDASARSGASEGKKKTGSEEPVSSQDVGMI